mmetsp:Transcript_45643/g.52574  ORF Transcript_45643/g.52574 Transcript_45643/m.52574 type:complete len:235 (-) Transcript_45643:255-959(-)
MTVAHVIFTQAIAFVDFVFIIEDSELLLLNPSTDEVLWASNNSVSAVTVMYSNERNEIKFIERDSNTIHARKFRLHSDPFIGIDIQNSRSNIGATKILPTQSISGHKIRHGIRFGDIRRISIIKRLNPHKPTTLTSIHQIRLHLTKILTTHIIIRHIICKLIIDSIHHLFRPLCITIINLNHRNSDSHLIVPSKAITHQRNHFGTIRGVARCVGEAKLWIGVCIAGHPHVDVQE